MKTRYLTLRGCDPIKVDFKDGTDIMLAIMNYIDCYGNDFLGLMSTKQEALKVLADDYIEFSDTHTTNDIDAILFLEDCLALELDTNI